MTPIIDAVKANALGFYDDVQTNLTAKGKNVDPAARPGGRLPRLRRRRRGRAGGVALLRPAGRAGRLLRVRQRPDRPGWRGRPRVGSGGGGPGRSTPRGPRPATVAGRSSWSGPTSPPTRSTRRWCPADLASRVPADFSALTDVWEDEQGLMGSSSKRLILFAPDGRAGATSRPSGRTSCITRPRPAAGCPRSTTARSSTPSATRCEPRSRRAGTGGAPMRPPGRACRSASTSARSPTRARTPTRSSATGPTWVWSGSSTGWAAPAAPSTRPPTARVPAPTWPPGSPGTWSSGGCWTCSSPTGT